MRAGAFAFLACALASALLGLPGAPSGGDAAFAAHLVTSIELPAGSGPSGIAVRENTHRLYVAGGDSIFVIDTDTRAVIATIAAGMKVGYLWPVPDWSALYVAGSDEQPQQQMNLKRFDTATNTFGDAFHVGPNPYYYAAAFGPDGLLYLCNSTRQEQPGCLLRVNPSTHELLGTLTLGAGSDPVVITPNGGKAYVGSFDRTAGGEPPPNHMYVVDLNSWSVQTKIPIGDVPCAAAISPSGADLYVLCREASLQNFWHILVQTDQVDPDQPEGFQVGAIANAMVLSPSGAKAFVANLAFLHGTDENWISNVAIVDLSQWQILENVVIPSEALRMALAPQSRLLYVTCFDANKIAVIDVSDHIASLPAKQQPVRVAAGGLRDASAGPRTPRLNHSPRIALVGLILGALSALAVALFALRRKRAIRRAPGPDRTQPNGREDEIPPQDGQACRTVV